MKKVLVAVAFLGFQSAQAKISSVYTDVQKDCIEVSSSTDQAPIDFLEIQCKAFGGYSLSISGGDLRYSPELAFGSKKIELMNPYAFHDLGSNKIEWMYSLTRNAEGDGQLTWKALIYRLDVQNNDTMRDESFLYVVRLDGEKSCSLGTAKTNEAARKLALSKAACLK